MKYSVALVEYLNTYPFYRGLQLIVHDLEIHRVSPSRCAELFKLGKVDISLCPAGALAEMPEHEIAGQYCIGADGRVSTVVLLSKVPLDEIRTVKLDPNSRTSNVLVQILAQKLWHREWQFYEKENGVVPEACVMIGDQVFEQKSKYPYHFDLADAWKALTDLPMVFAVWIARPGIPVQVIQQIDSAFEAGWNEVKNGSAPLASWQSEYLQNNISFPFDDRKREALQLFRQWAQDMLPVTTSRLA